MEYEFSGIRRLMAAVVLRAVRDVYHQEEWMQIEAKAWLGETGEYVLRAFAIDVPEVKLGEWVRSGFQECRVENLGFRD